MFNLKFNKMAHYRIGTKYGQNGSIERKIFDDLKSVKDYLNNLTESKKINYSGDNNVVYKFENGKATGYWDFEYLPLQDKFRFLQKRNPTYQTQTIWPKVEPKEKYEIFEDKLNLAGLF